MSFLERAKSVAGQAAKVSVDVAGQAAKVGAEVGGKAVATVRDPATQARAKSALKKAKRGFTTILERIDPKILADVVVKATSLQERANASLQERGSVYRIGQIQIGASIPPSIQFSIERVDDPDRKLLDSTALLAKSAKDGVAGTAEAIVSLDGTAVDTDILEAVADED
jgi:hypothetical protein